MRYLSLIIVPVLFLASCKKAKHYPPADYMIVGSQGLPSPFRDYFKITNTDMLEDTTSDYSKTVYSYHMPVSSGKFAKGKELLTSIPDELFAQNNAVFGNTALDGNFIEIQAMVEGKLYTWHFSGDKAIGTSALSKFFMKVEQAIE